MNTLSCKIDKINRNIQKHTKQAIILSYVGNGPMQNLVFASGLEAAYGQVVHHLLDLLHVVLERVEALPQRVVLEIQQPEAGAHLADEPGDLDGAPVVAAGDGIDGEPRQLRAQLQQPHQVVLEVQVEALVGTRLH